MQSANETGRVCLLQRWRLTPRLEMRAHMKLKTFQAKLSARDVSTLQYIQL